jgi:hypothetical protein
MKRVALYFSLAFSLLAHSAFAKDNLRTLSGFEKAFRRAHDRGSIRSLESLVYWDRTSSKQKRDMRDALRAGLGDRIREIETVPFYTAPLDPTIEPMHRFRPLHDPNLEPTHVLFVWYHLGVFHGMRYPVGRKNGRFYFVVARDWDFWMRGLPAIAKPKA